MIQLKFFGTGGQGVVTAAKMFSVAVSLFEGKYAITVPSYGHERRGAPVNTSIIVDDEPVLLNSFVYTPDVVLVLDSTVTGKGIDVAEGIHRDSILILNTSNQDVIDEYSKLGFKDMYVVNGTQIALDIIKRGIPNSAMLGALATAGCVSIEAVEKAIKNTFSEKAGESNAKAARETYNQTRKI